MAESLHHPLIHEIDERSFFIAIAYLVLPCVRKSAVSCTMLPIGTLQGVVSHADIRTDIRS